MKPRYLVLFGVGVALMLALPLVMLMFLVRMSFTPQAAAVNGFAPPDVVALEGFGMPMQQHAQPATAEEVAQARGAAAASREMQISGPFSHANLSVFFVHGPDSLQNRRFITLEQGVADNVAAVREGFQLAIDNRSDAFLFIQGGDIVKGGNQDRVLPYDNVLPPGAQNVPIAAFCVEQGRSFPRGDELSTSFQVASQQLPTRGLKLAALHQRSQVNLWSGIRQTQEQLTRHLGASVQAPLSNTSLQLTLEHPVVDRAADAYVRKLAGAVNDRDDVLGVVVAIDGDIQAADVYGSTNLFRNLWPKLMRASAVAALAEGAPAEGAIRHAAPTQTAVREFLSNAENGQAFRQPAVGTVQQFRHETERAVLLETCDVGTQKGVVHRCYLAK
jgi:hypothetical protein